MAEWDPESVRELSDERIDTLFGHLAETDFQSEFDLLAVETLGEGRFPRQHETSGFAVQTEEGGYQILGVPFEGVSSHEANVVIVFREGHPERLFSSVLEEGPDVLTVTRIEVAEGAIEPRSQRIDLTALGDFAGFQTPSLPDKCTSCQKVAAAAKYTGCGVAPGVICTVAGVPYFPSIGCDAVGALVCKELQERSNLTRQQVCERVGLCPP